MLREHEWARGGSKRSCRHWPADPLLHAHASTLYGPRRHSRNYAVDRQSFSPLRRRRRWTDIHRNQVAIESIAPCVNHRSCDLSVSGDAFTKGADHTHTMRPARRPSSSNYARVKYRIVLRRPRAKAPNRRQLISASPLFACKRAHTEITLNATP